MLLFLSQSPYFQWKVLSLTLQSCNDLDPLSFQLFLTLLFNMNTALQPNCFPNQTTPQNLMAVPQALDFL